MKEIIGVLLLGLFLAGCTNVAQQDNASQASGTSGGAQVSTGSGGPGSSYYANSSEANRTRSGGYYPNAVAGDDNNRNGGASGGGSGSTGGSYDKAASNVKEFTITASQFAYDPATITVNKGDTVILHIKSADVTHGLLLSAYGIDKQVSPGQDATVQFVADKAGTFEFHCNVPCGPGHREMTGQMVVR